MPDKLTVDELNRRLAKALGVEPKLEDLPLDDILPVITASRSGSSMPGMPPQLHHVFTWNSQSWDMPVYKETMFNTTREAEMVWEHRHTGDYKADIEAHVMQNAYTPPNYAGDLATAFTLGELMWERGLSWDHGEHLLELVSKNVDPYDGKDIDPRRVPHCLAHASAYDRALAALRALGGEEN
jgi:hypothetical protein